MKQPTLQTQYNLITEGKGNKFAFLREAKTKFPGYVPNSANFEQAVNILKTKNILNENYVDLQPINDWERKEESYEIAFKKFLKENNESEIEKAIDDYITFYTLPPQIDYTRPYKIKADKAEAYLKSLPDGQKYLDQAEQKIENYYGEEDEYGNSTAYYDSLFESKNIGKYALIVYNTKKNNNISQVLYKGVLSNVAMYSNNKETLEKEKERRSTKNKSAEGVDKIVLTSELKDVLKNIQESQKPSIKANSKKVAKEVEETQDNNYSNDDVKNLDNQIGQEVLNGIAFEARKHPDKTLDEIRAIVSKNLAKDKLYYLKNAAFGVEGIGYTEDVPGLKLSKSDQMQKVKLNENLTELSHGLANRAATKAQQTQPDKYENPLDSEKRYQQHWKFGEYVSPELKNSLEKLGLTKMGNSHGQTTLYFGDNMKNTDWKVIINSKGYYIEGVINAEYALDDSKKRLLSTIIKKIQSQLANSESLNESKKPSIDDRLTNQMQKVKLNENYLNDKGEYEKENDDLSDDDLFYQFKQYWKDATDKESKKDLLSHYKTQWPTVWPMIKNYIKQPINEGLFSKNKKPKVDGTYTVEFIKGDGKGHAKVFQDPRVAKGYKDQVNSIAKDEIAIVYPTGKRPENLGDYSANVVSENTNKLTLLTHTIMCKDENGQPRIAPKGTKVEFIDDFTFLLGGGRNGKVYTTNIEQLKGDGKNPIIPIINKQQNIQESKKPSIDDRLTNQMQKVKLNESKNKKLLNENTINKFLNNPEINISKNSLGGQISNNNILYSDIIVNGNVTEIPLAKYDNGIMLVNNSKYVADIIDDLVQRIRKHGYKIKYVSPEHIIGNNIQESKKPSIDDRLTKIEKAGEMATLEAKINAVDEAIKKRQERIDMIGENEDLADLINPVKLKEMQREIKLLEKQKNKLEKIYQKITGKKKQEVVGEVEDESEQLNEGEQYGKSPEEDNFLRKVKEENPEMLTRFISMVKNKGLEIAKEKYNEFDPKILKQKEDFKKKEEKIKKTIESFVKFLPKSFTSEWEQLKDQGKAPDSAFFSLIGIYIDKFEKRYGREQADLAAQWITSEKYEDIFLNNLDKKYGEHVIEW